MFQHYNKAIYNIYTCMQHKQLIHTCTAQNAPGPKMYNFWNNSLILQTITYLPIPE